MGGGGLGEGEESDFLTKNPHHVRMKKWGGGNWGWVRGGGGGTGCK